MTTLAAGVAYILVTLGLIAVIGGNVLPGVGLFIVGCAIAASTRLQKG